jgi:hypothetical protein
VRGSNSGQKTLARQQLCNYCATRNPTVSKNFVADLQLNSDRHDPPCWSKFEFQVSALCSLNHLSTVEQLQARADYLSYRIHHGGQNLVGHDFVWLLG